MSYVTRLSKAEYTPSGGAAISFLYEDVDKVTSKKTVLLDAIDGSQIVQELLTPRDQYPLKIIFAGVDHDLQAQAFTQALAQPGNGLLNHPRYGLLEVLPVGDIKQQEKLVKGAGQTIVNVTFVEASTPATQQSSSSLAGLSSVQQQAIASSFNSNVNVTNSYEQVSFENSVAYYVNLAQDYLSNTSETIANSQQAIASAAGPAVNIAGSLSALFSSASNEVDSLASYIDLLLSAETLTSYDNTAKNDNATRLAFAQAAHLAHLEKAAAAAYVSREPVVFRYVIIDGQDRQITEFASAQQLDFDARAADAVASATRADLVTKSFQNAATVRRSVTPASNIISESVLAHGDESKIEQSINDNNLAFEDFFTLQTVSEFKAYV